MGCPAGFILDPTGAVCIPDGSSTDPSYYPTPATGDIFGSLDGEGGGITPPQNTSNCFVEETDPVTGDTVAGCGSGGSGVQPVGVTPTTVSPSIWQSVGGALGGFLGGLTKIGVQSPTASVPVGSKRCPNGQIVLNSQACPVTSSSILGGSSGGTVIVLLLVGALILVFALRKN